MHNRKIQGSLQIIIKTARALNQILPWTIAIFTGGQLIVSLQPYLTVFLSARVVDLLSVHAKMEQVIALIVLSGAGTYTLIFLGKYFDSKRNVRGLDLYWAILWRMNRVLMKCPYSEVEKTKLRTQQEEIIQAYRMSGYGPWKIPEIMMELISGCVMIVMSIACVCIWCISYIYFSKGKERGAQFGVAQLLRSIAYSGVICDCLYSCSKWSLFNWSSCSICGSNCSAFRGNTDACVITTDDSDTSAILQEIS